MSLNEAQALLQKAAEPYSLDPLSLEFAKQLDAVDELRAIRHEFLFPKVEGHAAAIYLCGNSLGLQPKCLWEDVNFQLDKWANDAVEGYFTGTHCCLYAICVYPR